MNSMDNHKDMHPPHRMVRQSSNEETAYRPLRSLSGLRLTEEAEAAQKKKEELAAEVHKMGSLEESETECQLSNDVSLGDEVKPLCIEKHDSSMM